MPKPSQARATKRATQPNLQLRRARELKCWSQAELAERVGTTAFTVCRWERGATFPGPHFRRELCALFGCGPDQLGLLPDVERPQSASAAPQVSFPHHSAGSIQSRRNPQVATATNGPSRGGPSAGVDATIERELPRIEGIEAVFAGAETSCLSAAQIRAVLALAPALLARGHYARLEAVLLRTQRDIVRGEGGDAGPRIQLYLGRLAELRGHLAAAEQWYDDALRAARAAGDDALVARLLAHRSEVAINRGRYADVEPWLREGLELASAGDDRGTHANLLRLLGEARDCAGDFAQGDALYLQGLELAREGEDLEVQASLLQNLGEKALKRGRYDEAEGYLKQGLDAARATSHRQRTSALLAALAVLKHEQHVDAEAEELCHESVRIAREIGHPIRLINALLILGEILGHQLDRPHDADRADQPLREALYLARSIPHPFLIAECLVRLGEHQLACGMIEAAGEAFEDARNVSQRAGAHEMEASALFGLARVAVCQHDRPAALTYAARSLRYFAAEGHEKASEVESWLSSLPTGPGVVT